jgi:hypothetical protein
VPPKQYQPAVGRGSHHAGATLWKKRENPYLPTMEQPSFSLQTSSVPFEEYRKSLRSKTQVRHCDGVLRSCSDCLYERT